MDDCFCLPIIFGCDTQIQPTDNTQRLCPRCNNVAVVAAKNKMMFSLCCVPIFPMSSSHVWICTICNWEVKQDQGFEPIIPAPGMGGGGMYAGPPPQGQYAPARDMQPTGGGPGMYGAGQGMYPPQQQNGAYPGGQYAPPPGMPPPQQSYQQYPSQQGPPQPQYGTRPS